MLWGLKRFLRRLWKALRIIPVIWQDEDWDFDYLLDLIKWKLENMKKYFGEYDYLEDHAKVAQEIEEVIKNIDDYEDHITAYQKENSIPVETIYVSVPVENGCHRLMEIDKDTEKPLTEEQEEKIGNYYKYLYKFQQEKWEKIWDIVKDKAQGWWD